MTENFLNVKIKKLNPNAIIPSYAKNGDAGLDVVAVSKRETDKFIEYRTGLAFEIPKNHVMLIFPRSSLSNKDLILANSVGVIDSGYRGELFVRFKKTGKDIYEVGDKIAQIIIIPYPTIKFKETEELSKTERGDGGFGHTGK